MKRTSLGLFVALALVCAAARADDDDRTSSCVAQYIASCSKACTNGQCVQLCIKQAREVCVRDVAKPQIVFAGPVSAVPANACNPPDATACTPFTENSVGIPGACSTVSGRVGNRTFWGGSVTIYVICPSNSPTGHENPAPTATILGRTASSATDGTFTMTVSNSCSGQTGCYGLIAVAPPACAGCPANADPGWSPCTGAACPAP